MPKPQEYTDTFILFKKWFQQASEVFNVCQILSKDPVHIKKNCSSESPYCAFAIKFISNCPPQFTAKIGEFEHLKNGPQTVPKIDHEIAHKIDPEIPLEIVYLIVPEKVPNILRQQHLQYNINAEEDMLGQKQL